MLHIFVCPIKACINLVLVSSNLKLTSESNFQHIIAMHNYIEQREKDSYELRMPMHCNFVQSPVKKFLGTENRKSTTNKFHLSRWPQLLGQLKPNQAIII